MKIQRIKRKDLDLEKYSNALNASMNYRIYAEHWYLDVLTDEKWECLVYDDYDVIMPIPLQIKLGFKFVLQPNLCQQLGVFYREEISEELFSEFEKTLHTYRVRAYHFNEENSERYSPRGEQRVNFVLDLNTPYEFIYKKYRKDKRRSLKKASEISVSITKTDQIESFYSILKENYPNVQEPNKRLLKKLIEKELLVQYVSKVDDLMHNHRVFMLSKNRLYVIASVRNKDSKLDLSTSILDLIIQQHASTSLLLDFEGSMIPGVASFNEGFGAIKKIYTHFSNFNLKRSKT